MPGNRTAIAEVEPSMFTPGTSNKKTGLAQVCGQSAFQKHVGSVQD
jgi:hypothetical protein